MNENYVTVSGRLCADPEERVSRSGALFTTFRVASTVRLRRSDGAWEDRETAFFNVIAWRYLGRNAKDSLAKGHPVVVHGKLLVKLFDRTDGNGKNTSVEIEATSIGHDLTYGYTEYTKGMKLRLDPGDRTNDPVVAEARANNWGAGDGEGQVGSQAVGSPWDSGADHPADNARRGSDGDDGSGDNVESWNPAYVEVGPDGLPLADQRAGDAVEQSDEMGDFEPDRWLAGAGAPAEAGIRD